MMIGCIIQARMGSTRLPEKVMMKVKGNKTVLDYVINQLKFSKLIDKIIIATTILKQDDVIETSALDQGLEIFRGNSSDVLDRYYQCAKEFNLKHIVRITSDCPLIDPIAVDDVINKYLTGNFDYVSNTLVRTFPIGTDVEIFSFETLEKTWKHAKLPSEREHVTPFIRNKKMNFILGNIESKKNFSNIRVTLDRQEDLVLIQKIALQINKNPILIQDILELFSNDPQLFKVNQNIPSNEGMKKSLDMDEEFSNKTHN